MLTRSLLARIERIEQAAKGRNIFAPECICFPEDVGPLFHWPIEVEIASRVRCPIHGERFKPSYLIYVSEWLRKKREWFIRERTSQQFQKAWYASFPRDLWPAEEHEEGNTIFLVLKDGTRLAIDGLSGSSKER